MNKAESKEKASFGYNYTCYLKTCKPEGGRFRLLLPDVDPVFSVDLRQDIAQVLQKVFAGQRVEADQVVVLAVRRLVQLRHKIL